MSSMHSKQDPGELPPRVPDPSGTGGVSKPLVRCPRCASPALYPTSAHEASCGVALGRRCPECEHVDTVLTNRLAASLWYLRHSRRYQELSALAHARGDGLALDLDDELRQIVAGCG
jgi:hypothetical protein